MTRSFWRQARLLPIVALLLGTTAALNANEYTLVAEWRTIQATDYSVCGGCSGWSAEHAGDPDPHDRICSFVDPLPEGAVLTSLDILVPLSRSYPPWYSWTEVVNYVPLVNDFQIGTVTSITNYEPYCDQPLTTWQFSGTHSSGLPGYVYGGTNTFTQRLWDGSVLAQPATFVFRYKMGVNISTHGGDGQSGLAQDPLPEHLEARITAPEGFDVSGHEVTFEITTMPKNASGAAIGADGGATAQSYVAVTDINGIARAVLRLGDAEGEYLVAASHPDSITGEPATFTAIAKVPDSIRIARGTSSEPAAKYTVPLLDETRFRALAYDSAGIYIAPLPVEWSVKAKGKSAGSATVSSTSESEGLLEPEAAGTIDLVATPPKGKYNGLKPGSADVLITGVFLDVDGDFDIANPVDDLDWWVPGSESGGKTSVPPPHEGDWTAPLQTVTLRIPTAATKNGELSLELQDVTSYPGVAMNWPPKEHATLDKDLWFDDNGIRVQKLAAVPVDPSGVTSVPLYVGDYAAFGKLHVTLGASKGKDPGFPALSVTLPRSEQFQSLLPDTGWTATSQIYGTLSRVKINNSGLSPTLDEDDNPANPPATIVDRSTWSGIYNQPLGLEGDGLTNFEEYRGFIVQGQHRRFNPFHKDLGVVLDDIFTLPPYRTYLRKLPLSLHEFTISEIHGSSPANLSPRIDSNEVGLLSVGAQRAVRLRSRTAGAPSWKAPDGGPLPIWGVNRSDYFTAFGATFYDGMDIDTLESASADTGTGHSPNHTQVAEIYPQAFVQFRIYPGPDGTFESFHPCGTWSFVQPGLTTGCDGFQVDQDGELYVDPGPDRIMNTVCASTDRCLMEVLSCGSASDPLYLEDQTVPMAVTAAHELGHAVNMYHTYEITPPVDPCGTIMGYMSHPLTSTWSEIELRMIRLHENF